MNVIQNEWSSYSTIRIQQMSDKNYWFNFQHMCWKIIFGYSCDTLTNQIFIINMGENKPSLFCK
jgi:hypothetical protein